MKRQRRKGGDDMDKTREGQQEERSKRKDAPTI